MRYFIHYNHTNLEDAKIGIEKQKERFQPYKKPYGLWACDTTQEYNWYDYCISEEVFETKNLDKHFSFRLKSDAKILIVDVINDLKKYIYNGSINGDIDYIAIMKDYDGIEITERMIRYISAYSLSVPLWLNAYDIPSICVWNLNAIIIEDED